MPFIQVSNYVLDTQVFPFPFIQVFPIVEKERYFLEASISNVLDPHKFFLIYFLEASISYVLDTQVLPIVEATNRHVTYTLKPLSM